MATRTRPPKTDPPSVFSRRGSADQRAATPPHDQPESSSATARAGDASTTRQTPAPPSDAKKAALRALVPSAYNPTGESDPFLQRYKARWLSTLDFKSESSINSLLVLAFLLLAREREREAEEVADVIGAHARTKQMRPASLETLLSALHLSIWLKTRRGLDAAALTTRATNIARFATARDREWLSTAAMQELADAQARGRLHLLVGPLSGIMRWLNDTGARHKAAAVLSDALAIARAMMDADAG
jgi:hypothetical protein